MPQSQYLVKPGDTLLNIAESHDRSVQQIRQLNNLNSNIIYVGQMLRIPTSTATYTVQQGDTLLTISDRFQVSSIYRMTLLLGNWNCYIHWRGSYVGYV